MASSEMDTEVGFSGEVNLVGIAFMERHPRREKAKSVPNE